VTADRIGDGAIQTGRLQQPDRARLRELGFELGARAEAGESGGAWFATAPDGAAVVLKWFPDEAVAARYATLLPALNELRSRGVPVPRYPHVLAVDGWTVSAQERLPGASVRNPAPALVERVVDCIGLMAGIECALPAPGVAAWGASVVQALTSGVEWWAPHEPMRTGGRRSAAVLDRVEAIGADADAAWFPSDGLVHLDLHTDNVLAVDGTLTGVIDWEDACAGDPRFDLVKYAFDLDGHDQPIWELVEATGIEPRVLRVYVAHDALCFTSWAMRHHPDDVPRQLDRAERVLDRYGG
jgi:aminoglycoside phosphotransferase (APT) family kinase protein